MQEYVGQLVDGNRFRVTSYLVEITDPAGSVVRQIDVAYIASVTRRGQTVILQLINQEIITLATVSLDDAGRLEAMLRAARPPQAPPPPLPVEKKGRGFQWLAIAGACIIGLIMVAALLSTLDSSGDDVDEAQPPASAPSASTTIAEPSATAPAEEATEPADEPAPTEIPEVTATVAVAPTHPPSNSAAPTTGAAPPRASNTAGAGRSEGVSLSEMGRRLMRLGVSQRDASWSERGQYFPPARRIAALMSGVD